MSWVWTEESLTEDQVTRAARARAHDLDTHPISPATGAALRMLAASARARAVIEIGTGTGVSGLWLLEGMVPSGVLTTIDAESECTNAARRAFREAGLPTSRTRLINGRALDVLPRMAYAAYDIVFIDADVRQLDAYILQARRMLRAGGIIAVAHALWGDNVSDPARRDEGTVAMRHAVTGLMKDPDLLTTVLTCGDGLAVSVMCTSDTHE